MASKNIEEDVEKVRQEKMKALEATLGNIEKSFGKGSIMRLGDNKQEKIDSNYNYILAENKKISREKLRNKKAGLMGKKLRISTAMTKFIARRHRQAAALRLAFKA